MLLPIYILLSPFFRAHDNSVKRRDIEVKWVAQKKVHRRGDRKLTLASTMNPASVTWEQRAASRILGTHRHTKIEHNFLAWWHVRPCQIVILSVQPNVFFIFQALGGTAWAVNLRWCDCSFFAPVAQEVFMFTGARKDNKDENVFCSSHF